VVALHEKQSDDELRKIQRYFRSGEGEYGEGDVFLGVRMGDVFALAKAHIDMPPAEIEVLLDDRLHEVRAGACSIMAKQAARKRTTDHRRRELYDLYLRRHDRIDNWDLVDLAARDVVGARVADHPDEVDGDVLGDLARSDDVWRRRTAIVATHAFQQRGDLDETYRIAGILLHDDHDLIHKAVGGWVRNAGKADRPRLLAFLDAHAASMPRTMLRYASEHLDPDQRAHYRALPAAP
jgi:3-methyladenine DNA glycosylase AlkD